MFLFGVITFFDKGPRLPRNMRCRGHAGSSACLWSVSRLHDSPLPGKATAVDRLLGSFVNCPSLGGSLSIVVVAGSSAHFLQRRGRHVNTVSR